MRSLREILSKLWLAHKKGKAGSLIEQDVGRLPWMPLCLFCALPRMARDVVAPDCTGTVYTLHNTVHYVKHNSENGHRLYSPIFTNTSRYFTPHFWACR